MWNLDSINWKSRILLLLVMTVVIGNIIVHTKKSHTHTHIYRVYTSQAHRPIDSPKETITVEFANITRNVTIFINIQRSNIK